MPVGDILGFNAFNWPDRVGLVAADRRITGSLSGTVNVWSYVSSKRSWQ